MLLFSFFLKKASSTSKKTAKLGTFLVVAFLVIYIQLLLFGNG